MHTSIHGALGFALCTALLWCAPARAVEVVFRGELAEGDKVHKDRKGYIDYHLVQAKAGQLLTVSMMPADKDNSFDTYLIVTGPAGQQYSNDDAEGGGSRVAFRVPETGEWEIGATAYGEGEAGPYVVRATVHDLKVLLGQRGDLDEDEDEVLLKEGELYDKYALPVEAGKTYVVLLASADFDTFLSVHYPGGFVSNDDAEGMSNASQVLFSPDKAGEATIVVTSAYTKQEGRYQLAAYEAVDTAAPSDPAAQP